MDELNPPISEVVVAEIPLCFRSARGVIHMCSQMATAKAVGSFDEDLTTVTIGCKWAP